MRPLALVLAASALGCATESPSLDDLEQAVTCPSPTIDPARSLVVTDATALAKFGFERVLTQIATSGKATNTPTNLYRTWMKTFNDCAADGIDPHDFGLQCRPEVGNSLAVAAFDPFGAQGYIPLAVVDRFDLAPKSGANCGEYRVVFATPGPVGAVARNLLIFEARLPNPHPELGLTGCAPVADFWANLSTDADAASRATKLETFYFTGITGFDPVVAASHYGLAVDGGAHATGQIRTNFLTGQWFLREFKLRKPCAATASCVLAVEHVTVKVNPANEVFANSGAFAVDFQTKFLAQIPALSATSAATIGMASPGADNEWESVSLGAQDVVYRNFASTAFRTKIKNAITTGLSVNNILDRATTQTCAGCHQLSNGAVLGKGITWPSSLGFVQIDEQHRLSPALTTSFLPHRKQVLEDFLATQCAGTTVSDDGANIGGGAADAAN